MKLAVPRRFTPPRLAGRTKIAALALAGGVVAGSLVLGALFFLSIWPFSSDDIDVDRGSISNSSPNSVTYQTDDGVRIAASWYVPKDAKNPPVVVLLHEKDGTRAQMAPLVPVLLNAGYAVLSPDIRGFGDSTTIVRDGKEGPVQFASRPDAILDVSAALKWLKSQREVDSGRVGVIGARLGGDLAYVSTGLFPEVKAAVAITTTRYTDQNTDPLIGSIGDYVAHDVCFIAGGRPQWEDVVTLGIRTVAPGGRRILEHPDLDGVALLAVDEPIRNMLGWFDARLRRDGHQETKWCSANA